MKRLIAWAAAALVLVGSARAEGPKTLAEGEWSKPVADSRGRAVRGRLVLGEKPAPEGRRAVAVYVELQEASEAIGGSLRLFCEMGKSDFRPEYKGGLNCEMKDKDGKTVKSAPFPFGGAVPRSEWITLPPDGTIRLRASPFGISQAGALAISPHLGALWIIPDGDPGEYSLSGTFTIDSPKERTPTDDEHIWRGTLELPAVRIVNRRK